MVWSSQTLKEPENFERLKSSLTILILDRPIPTLHSLFAVKNGSTKHPTDSIEVIIPLTESDQAVQVFRGHAREVLDDAGKVGSEPDSEFHTNKYALIGYMTTPLLVNLNNRHRRNRFRTSRI